MTALPPDIEAQLGSAPGWLFVAALGAVAFVFWLAASRRDAIPLLALLILCAPFVAVGWVR